MTQIISFPGLGLSFTIDPNVITIGNFSIRWYGLLIAIAFFLGACFVLHNTKKFGLDGDRVIDVLFGAILIGVVGARLYYVVFSWDMYKDNLLDIFKIWEGGIAIYGGVIAAIVGGWFLCRWRKVRFLPLLDLSCAGLILAQAIGRWGNFTNGEAFGSVTTLPWRMTSRYASGSGSTLMQRYLASVPAEQIESMGGIDAVGVHPTFLYESIWCLLGFFLLVWLIKRRKFDGQMFLVYVSWYGAERFIVEGLRTDSLMIGSLRVSQLVAIVSAVAALIVMAVVLQKIRSSNDPDYLKLYVNTPEGQSVVAGTFYPKKASHEKVVSADPENGEKTAEDIDEGRALSESPADVGEDGAADSPEECRKDEDTGAG